MLRQEVHVHDRRVREGARALEPVWLNGPAPDIDEDAVRLEKVVADPDSTGPFEASVPLEYCGVLHSLQPRLDTPAGGPRHAVLSGLDLLHVDGDGAIEDDAVLGGPARHVGDPRGGHQRLGRNTADVDARPSEEVPFDDRHLHPGPGEPTGEGRAGLPGPDNDRVVLRAHELASCEAL